MIISFTQLSCDLIQIVDYEIKQFIYKKTIHNGCPLGCVKRSSRTKTYYKEIEAQLKLVENNLYSCVIINDKAGNILDRMAHFKVKGVSIAVIENSKIIWAKGYGYADVGEGRKVNNNALFPASSMSEPINALGILKLAQEGKVSLNTDVNNQLKSWKFTYDSASWNKITPANL